MLGEATEIFCFSLSLLISFLFHLLYNWDANHINASNISAVKILKIGGGAIVDRGRAYNLIHFLLTIRLYSICIKIVLKGGSGGPPPENFYKIRYKIRLF